MQESVNLKKIFKNSINSLIWTFVVINAVFACLLNIKIPYECYQKYSTEYLIDTSFVCSSSKVYFLPLTAVFEDSKGKSNYKQILDKGELFCISNKTSSLATKIPSRRDFNKLNLDISFFKGTLKISDLVIGGISIPLNNENVKLLTVTDKSSLEFDNGQLVFNSVPKNNFDLNTIRIEIPDSFFSQLKKDKTDFSTFASIFYSVCFKVQSHKNYGIVFALILLSLLALKYPYSYLIRALLFISFCTLSYISILYPYTSQLFITSRIGNEYDAITKIILSQFPTILVMCVPLFIYQVIRWGAPFWMLLGFILFSVYVSDLFTIAQFSTHPSISDIFNFSTDVLKSKHLIYNFVVSNKLVVLGIIVSLLIYISLWAYIRYEDWYSVKINRALFILLMFTISVIPQKEVLKDDLLDSIYSISLKSSNSNIDYSESYQFRTDESAITTIDGLNRRKNVIIVMVESLSANESQFWDGNYNHTKHLDLLAKEYFTFKNYYANNFNTDRNNFSFLASVPYLNNKKSHKDAVYYHNTLPLAFKREGYATHAMSAADDIGGLKKVWELAGFDNFHESDDPFYKDSERLTFNSVPDLDLFNCLLSKLNDWEKNGPYFTFVMTSTSHGPYIVPKTHELDYHKCIEYVDESLNYLYQALLKRGFFENGTLVITADHRYMENYTYSERKKHDKRGITRVPLLIIDQDYKNISINQPFSHSQMGQFIEYLNLKKVDLYKFNFLPSFKNDSKNTVMPIYYQYHTPSDLVLVITSNSKDGEYEVKLNGDNTKITSSIKNENLKRKILEDIYLIRK